MNKLNRRSFLEGTLAASAGLGAARIGSVADGSESVGELPKRNWESMMSAA